MNTSQPSETTAVLSVPGLPRAVRPYSGRRALIGLAAAIVVLGLALNWSWLVAAGIAPLLLSALPCAAMCALGLCMGRMGGRSCQGSTAPGQADVTPPRPGSLDHGGG
jgi:uncharacterized membrane protein YadS